MDTLLVVLIVILIIVVLIRGPKTLPLIGGMLGRGVKETRKEVSEMQRERDASAAAAAPVDAAPGDPPPTTPPPTTPPSTTPPTPPA